MSVFRTHTAGPSGKCARCKIMEMMKYSIFQTLQLYMYFVVEFAHVGVRGGVSSLYATRVVRDHRLNGGTVVGREGSPVLRIAAASAPG